MVYGGITHEVTEITIRKKQVKKERVTVDVQRGFEQEATFSWSTLGFIKCENFNQLNFNYIACYRFNHYLFAGVGTGLDFEVTHNGRYKLIYNHNYYEDWLPVPTLSIPLYAHLRAYFMKTRVAPFLAFSVGTRLSTEKEVEIDDGAVTGYIEQKASRMMLEVMPGVCYRYSKDLAFNFQIGYAATSAIQLYGPSCHDCLAHGLSVKLGVTF